MKAPVPRDVELAMNRLKSLHDGELGLLDVVDCGERALPSLRELVFSREPSGIYQPRCLAVRALATLGDYDALIDFLRNPNKVSDAIERQGEEAVVNAAARALAQFREDRVFDLLLSIAERDVSPGVIDALARFERVEAIPYFVAALSEDDCRWAGERALRKLGSSAVSSLLIAAASQSASGASDADLRKRISALRLLIVIGVDAQSWPVLRHLVRHANPKVSMLACGIALEIAPYREKQMAVQRLNELLGEADWPLNREIEQEILAHPEIARNRIVSTLEKDRSHKKVPGAQKRLRQALLRLAALMDWRGY